VKSVLIVVVILLGSLASFGQTLSLSASTLTTFQLTSDPTSAQTLSVTTVVGGFFFVIPQVNLCAYMTQNMNGAAGNTTSIPDSSVQLNNTSIVTGTSNCSVTNAYQIANHASALCFCTTKTYNDSATVRIASYPANLEADTYTGTITLVAVAQ